MPQNCLRFLSFLYFFSFLFVPRLFAEPSRITSSTDDAPSVWDNACYPLEEVRAVWLATIGGIDWPRAKATDVTGIRKQQQELCTILNRLQKANINTVLLQTRVRGTVIYPSAIEPWDDCLTGSYGKHPGYDPLAFAIDECHRRGMELHAWLVTIPLGTVQKQRSYGARSITKQHPELCKTTGGEVFMQPSVSGTADYVARLCKEIIDHYDVDGISLDYIRYPESVYHFSDRCSAAERRVNISRIVQKVHDVVKSVKPWVKLSSSPIGKYRDLKRYSSGGWNCFNAVYQDPQLWLREGWQDMLFPMMYFKGNNFYPFLFDWKEHAYGHPVACGLGVYFLDPREGKWTLNDIRAQIYTARKSGIGGVCIYRSDFLTRNCKGIYDACCEELFPYPALTPRMTWGTDTVPPVAPTSLTCADGVLSWKPSRQRSANEILYNVYGSNVYPVDVTQAENLLMVRVKGSRVDLSSRATGRHYFAVCATDRFGNQSRPLQEKVVTSLPSSSEVWNPCSRIGVNGTRLNDRMRLVKSAAVRSKAKSGKKRARKR